MPMVNEADEVKALVATSGRRKTPKVSIGMPVFNGEHFIRSALDSLLAQTFNDFELIISDNASNDGTEAICLAYEELDSRIRYVRHAINRGAMANFQFVLEEAVGEYFMWAAVDDVRSDNFIEVNFFFLENHSDYGASVSPVRFEGGDFNDIAMGDRALDDDDVSTRLIKFFSGWHANGRFYSLFRRQLLLGISLDSIDFLAGDWFLVIFMLFHGKINRASGGYLVLGRNGMSKSSNLFSRFNKNGFLYFVFPFKDLYSSLGPLVEGMKSTAKLNLFVRLSGLGLLAFAMNIKLSVFNLGR